MRILLIILFCQIFFKGSAQIAKVDSLMQQLDKASNSKQRAIIFMALSSEYSNVDLFKALEYSDKSIKLADRLDHDSLSIATRLNQGTIFLQTGNYPRALELCTYVIRESKKISAPLMQVIATTNIGTIHYRNNDDKNALNYYLASLKYFPEEGVKKDQSIGSRRAVIMNNIGIIYEETKRFDSANYYYQKALVLSEQVHDSVNIANVLNNFGTLHRDQGDASSAITYYNRAKFIRELSNDKFGLARSYYSIGTFYFKILNDTEKAEPYLKKAIEFGSEIGAWQTVGSASSQLHKLYKERGEYNKAYDALLLTRQVNDSLFNKESTRKIAQLEMQSEFDRKQTELNVKQKERELHYYMGAGGLVFLLIIVTLLFFLQRSKTRRSQLEQVHLELEKTTLKNDLAIKDKELATNIMYLLNKNELINTISEKLLTIKQQVNIESQGAVQKVVLDLQSNLQPEVWQDFEIRFQQVHARFYKVLNEKFPDLSPSERRLCAFLKLDMTTKEISSITHQNTKSIDVARTRLRKKLNLTGTDHNLITFLAQLDKIDSAH